VVPGTEFCEELRRLRGDGEADARLAGTPARRQCDRGFLLHEPEGAMARINPLNPVSSPSEAERRRYCSPRVRDGDDATDRLIGPGRRAGHAASSDSDGVVRWAL
jgi:hypothetical protein